MIEVTELGVTRTGRVVMQGSVLGLNRLSLSVSKSAYNVCNNVNKSFNIYRSYGAVSY